MRNAPAETAIERDFGILTDKAVPVVEDDCFLGAETADAVRRARGPVPGPMPDMNRATAILEQGQVDAAILAIRLDDETSFPVVQALSERGVQFVFVGGYDDRDLPNEFDDVPACREPADPDDVSRLPFASKRGNDDRGEEI